jgi:hypothetical protein
VAVDLVEHLRVDPRQDAGEELGAHPIDVALRDLGEDLLRDVDHGARLLVGRPAQPVAEMVPPPPGELSAGHEPVAVRDSREDHAAGPRHQRLVEVEEGGGLGLGCCHCAGA